MNGVEIISMLTLLIAGLTEKKTILIIQLNKKKLILKDEL